MATLLLRLAGPMQSWGGDSHFETRLTEHMPTKSALVGMIAAAQGRRRDESIADLASLHFGFRADQPGRMIEDFHTARTEKTSYITRRYYLSDAVFLAGIESGNREELEKIAEDLNHPSYPLFLGRRSCPPDPRLVLEIVDLDLWQALNTYPLQGRKPGKGESITCFIEGPGNGCRRLLDEPVSFNPEKREFKSRLVSRRTASPELMVKEDLPETDHDAFDELEVKL